MMNQLWATRNASCHPHRFSQVAGKTDHADKQLWYSTLCSVGKERLSRVQADRPMSLEGEKASGKKGHISWDGKRCKNFPGKERGKDVPSRWTSPIYQGHWEEARCVKLLVPEKWTFRLLSAIPLTETGRSLHPKLEESYSYKVKNHRTHSSWGLQSLYLKYKMLYLL